MIEVACSKAQYKRLIEALNQSGWIGDRCVLGKNEYSCPICKGKSDDLNCRNCLEEHIKRKEDEGK